MRFGELSFGFFPFAFFSLGPATDYFTSPVASYCITISAILHILSCTELCCAFAQSQTTFYQKSDKQRATVSSDPSVHANHRWSHASLTESSSKPSLTKRWFARPRSIWPNRFARPRPADRRLFFSFNQMLLSLIAPRLMRYQFDLMMHSVVAELFRKILVPAVGTFSGDSNSIFSSIGNLLRLRQTAPRTTTAAPTVDVQRLLDNANKLIALQSLMRNNRNNPATSNNNPISAGSQEHSANGSVNQETNKHRDHSATVTDAQIDRQNSSQSPPNTNTEQPIHMAISTKDFLNFLQNNLKQNQANYNSTAKNTAFQLETSSNINHRMHGTSFGHSHSESPIDEAKATSNGFQEESLKKSTFSPRHRTRMEDFKMSHLTFIDTEVPNYGNQLLVRDHEDPNGLRESDQSQESVDSTRSQLGLIDPSLLNEKEFNNLKSDDLERVNRWNDVLVNMNSINESQNG